MVPTVMSGEPIFEATNLQRAREFAKSPDLQKTMVQVGVVGKPDITFLRD